MTDIDIAIPFRDRGRDPLRQANLDRVMAHWASFGHTVTVVDDGRQGGAQFNRSAAYNRATALSTAEVMVFTESDMLLPYSQIQAAVELAAAAPGLVVPFDQYRYLTETDSTRVRSFEVSEASCTPEWTMDDGRSIGAVNIVSRETLRLVGGYDEGFEGSWWDDRAMRRAFEIAAGPTRWVQGSAFHLWHLPGWSGNHLTAEDKAATARNKTRYRRYLSAQTPERIRELTSGAA